MFMCQNENEQSQAASENLKKFTIATLCTMIEANRRGGVILHHLTISTPFVNIHIATIPTLSLRSSSRMLHWYNSMRWPLARQVNSTLPGWTLQEHSVAHHQHHMRVPWWNLPNTLSWGRGEWISQFIPTQGSERTLSQHRWEGLVLLPCTVD